MHTTSTPAFSPEALWDLEEDLNTIQVLGTPLGSSLEYLFSVCFLRHPETLTARAALFELFQACFSIGRPCFDWLRARTARTDLESVRGRLLVTAMTARSSSLELITPVIEAYGPDRCAVIGSEDEVASRLPPGVRFLRWDKAFRTTYRHWEWAHSAFPDVVKLGRVGKEFFRSRQLPRLGLAFLTRWLVVQSQRVQAFGRLLQEAEPEAIFTPYDRSYYASTLVLAARRLGIPSVTYLHGAVNDYGYTPVLADLVMVWGAKSEAQLRARGVPSEKIRVVGCHHRSRELVNSRDTVRRKAGLPAQARIVTLATSGESADEHKRMFRALGEAVQQAPGWLGVVRLHPSQKISPELKSFLQDKGLLVTANDVWTMDEALAASDLVLVRDSGFGTDALIKRTPVAVLHLGGLPLQHGRTLVEGGCPEIADSSNLGDLMDALERGRWPDSTTRRRWDAYVGSMCCAFGSDAARRAVHVIDEVMARGSAIHAPSREAET